MTNYDMDQLRREGKVPDEIEREIDRDAFASAKVKIPENDPTTIEIELADDDILKLALAAHDRDITLNQLCIAVLRDNLKTLDYRFEHQLKPQVLKEY